MYSTPLLRLVVLRVQSNDPMAGYDRERSQVSDDKLSEWLGADLTECIMSVPGIGPSAATALSLDVTNECGEVSDPGITTTFQLLGKFLHLRQAGMTTQAHCDAMWHWLKSRGVATYRAGIVHCLLEKALVMVPSIGDNDHMDASEEAA